MPQPGEGADEGEERRQGRGRRGAGGEGQVGSVDDGRGTRPDTGFHVSRNYKSEKLDSDPCL